jgi:hypothetical protein
MEHRWGGRRGAVVVAVVVAVSLVGAAGILMRDERSEPVSASDGAEAWVSELEYPAGATCTPSGVTDRTTVWDEDADQVWIDFGSDGAADVVRIRDDVHLRAESFPTVAAPRPWIHIVLDVEDPVFQELQTSTLVQHAREAMVDEVAPPSATIDADVAGFEALEEEGSPFTLTRQRTRREASSGSTSRTSDRCRRTGAFSGPRRRGCVICRTSMSVFRRRARS